MSVREESILWTKVATWNVEECGSTGRHTLRWSEQVSVRTALPHCITALRLIQFLSMHTGVVVCATSAPNINLHGIQAQESKFH